MDVIIVEIRGECRKFASRPKNLTLIKKGMIYNTLVSIFEVTQFSLTFEILQIPIIQFHHYANGFNAFWFGKIEIASKSQVLRK